MEYEEHENIKKRDWRLQAITTVSKPYHSSSGHIYPVGTPVELVGFAKHQHDLLTLKVPNGAALYLNIAIQARDMINKLSNQLFVGLQKGNNGFISIPSEREGILFKYFEQSSICVIFSFTSLEAFCNLEIPDDFEYKQKRKDGRSIEIFNKKQIERYINIDIKLGVILPDIKKIKSPKSKKIWGEYVWLRKLRDRIIHLKKSDARKSSPDDISDYVWALLLKEKIQNSPEIAVKLMRYYYPKKQPRWLVKCPIN